MDNVGYVKHEKCYDFYHDIDLVNAIVRSSLQIKV